MNSFEKGMTTLLLGQLSELFYCENQLVRALDNMAAAARSLKLKKLFRDHRAETIGHVDTLGAVFKELGETPRAYPCRGLEGLLEDGKWKMNLLKNDPALDTALVMVAQKVELYEVASYRSLIQMAQQLGHDKVAGMCTSILEQETAADEKLSRILDARSAGASIEQVHA